MTEPLSEQDPWESRLAWRDVREALQKGDMQTAADAKSKLENGQREMRKLDGDGKNWNRLFYDAGSVDEVADRLAREIGDTIDPKETVAAWKFRIKDWNEGKFQRPYRGGNLPDNSHRQGQMHKDGDEDEALPETNGEPVMDDRPSTSFRDGKIEETSLPISESNGVQQGSSLEPSEKGSKTNLISAEERTKIEDFLRDRSSNSAGR